MSESARVDELRKKHAALSAKVEAIQSAPGSDDFEIVELKKQKLRIKEEITRLTAAT